MVSASRKLSLLLSLLLFACGSAGTSGDGGTDETSDSGDGDGDGDTGYTGDDPDSDCEGRLDPIEPAGAVEVVGDGSAASCTEPALHDAVAALEGMEGGTLTFDCDGEHTIELTQSVYVATSITIDGGGEITLSGGGQVRVIELDNSLDFVLQRITIPAPRTISAASPARPRVTPAPSSCPRLRRPRGHTASETLVSGTRLLVHSPRNPLS